MCVGIANHKLSHKHKKNYFEAATIAGWLYLSDWGMMVALPVWLSSLRCKQWNS